MSEEKQHGSDGVSQRKKDTRWNNESDAGGECLRSRAE